MKCALLPVSCSTGLEYKRDTEYRYHDSNSEYDDTMSLFHVFRFVDIKVIHTAGEVLILKLGRFIKFTAKRKSRFSPAHFEVMVLMTYILAAFRRKLFPTTLTELNAIAAPAIIGSRRNPFTG